MQFLGVTHPSPIEKPAFIYFLKISAATFNNLTEEQILRTSLQDLEHLKTNSYFHDLKTFSWSRIFKNKTVLNTWHVIKGRLMVGVEYYCDRNVPAQSSFTHNFCPHWARRHLNALSAMLLTLFSLKQFQRRKRGTNWKRRKERKTNPVPLF